MQKLHSKGFHGIKVLLIILFIVTVFIFLTLLLVFLPKKQLQKKTVSSIPLPTSIVAKMLIPIVENKTGKPLVFKIKPNTIVEFNNFLERDVSVTLLERKLDVPSVIKKAAILDVTITKKGSYKFKIDNNSKNIIEVIAE